MRKLVLEQNIDSIIKYLVLASCHIYEIYQKRCVYPKPNKWPIKELLTLN